MVKGLVIPLSGEVYITEVDYKSQGKNTFGRKLALIQFSLGNKSIIPNYNINGLEIEENEEPVFNSFANNLLQDKLGVEIDLVKTNGTIVVFSSDKHGDVQDVSDELVQYLGFDYDKLIK